MEAGGDRPVELLPLGELPPLQLLLAVLLSGEGPDLDDGAVLHQDPLSDVDTQPPVRHSGALPLVEIPPDAMI